MDALPRSVLSRPLLGASIAIYTTVALVAFEGLAVAAALPQVAADLGRVDLLPWVITAYFLSSGVTTVISGALVDMLGTRVMFRVAVVVFVTGGVAAAIVTTMPLMILARLVQGAGGGMLVSVGLAGVSLIYPEHLVSRAFAANSTVWGVMGVAGPGIAAAMLTLLSWRWIFLVNLPLGVVALAAGWRVMPGPVSGEQRGFDPIGTALIVVFTGATLVAVDRFGPESVPWALAAGLATFAYLRHARRIDHPILELGFLVRQPYAGLALSIGLLLSGAIGTHAYLTLYVQGGKLASAAVTAWSVVFFTVGWTVGANIGGRVLDRLSESGVLLTGMLIATPGLLTVWLFALADAPLAYVFAAFAATGIGVGGATNAALTLLRATTPATGIGRAMAAHQFARNQGFSVGAALGGAVLLVVLHARIDDFATVQAVLARAEGITSDSVAEAIRVGFGVAALVGVVQAAVAVIPAVVLRKHLGQARAARRQTR